MLTTLALAAAMTGQVKPIPRPYVFGSQRAYMAETNQDAFIPNDAIWKPPAKLTKEQIAERIKANGKELATLRAKKKKTLDEARRISALLAANTDLNKQLRPSRLPVTGSRN